LLTVTVYAAPVCPWKKLPELLIAIVRSDATTFIEAEAALPAPAFAAVTLPVVFTRLPTATAVTFTEIWHVLFAGIVPFDKLTEVVVVVMVPEPQEPLRPLGFASVSPAGIVSVNATPLSALPELGLEMVKLNDVDPPTPIEAAPNAFVIAGANPTAKLAEAVLPVPPLVEVIEPVALV
jgi:hypothetical protein